MLIIYVSLFVVAICLLAVLAMLGHRKEVGQCTATGLPTVDEYVTRPMLSLSQLAVRLAAVVYERIEDLPKLISSAADPDHPSDWETEVVTNEDHSAVICIVREIVGDRRVLIVARGTNISNARQVWANLKTRQVDFLGHCFWRKDLRVNQLPKSLADALVQNADPGLSVGKVHRGVANLFNSDFVGMRVMNAIENDVLAGRPITLVGHSQAGAVCQLLAATMYFVFSVTVDRRWLPSAMITFGSMRCGCEHFADVVERSCLHRPQRSQWGIMRYRFRRDGVPTMPFLIMGYRHAGQDLQITSFGHVRRQPLRLVLISLAIRDFVRLRWFRWLKHHPMANYRAAIERLAIPPAV